MMFWASWVWGPAAGPKGDSIFSEKMGRAWPFTCFTTLSTPKMLPWALYSFRTQLISWGKGMGRIMSLIEITSFLFSAAFRGESRFS